jgi:hypothetical protein
MSEVRLESRMRIRVGSLLKSLWKKKDLIPTFMWDRPHIQVIADEGYTTTSRTRVRQPTFPNTWVDLFLL